MYTIGPTPHEAASTGPLGRHREIAYETASRRSSLKRTREASAKEGVTNLKRRRQLEVGGTSATPGTRGRLGPVKAARLRFSGERKKRGCRKSDTDEVTWVSMDTDSAASDDVELLIGLFQRFHIGENRMGHETLA